MALEGIGLDALDERRTEAFLSTRKPGYRTHGEVAILRLLVDHLRDRGRVRRFARKDGLWPAGLSVMYCNSRRKLVLWTNAIIKSEAWTLLTEKTTQRVSAPSILICLLKRCTLVDSLPDQAETLELRFGKHGRGAT